MSGLGGYCVLLSLTCVLNWWNFPDVIIRVIKMTNVVLAINAVQACRQIVADHMQQHDVKQEQLVDPTYR